MTRILLHIGYGKTGSSSIQTFLSQHLSADSDQPYQYCAVDRGGNVVTGRRLAEQAARSPVGYVASHGDLTLEGFDVSAMRRGVEAIMERGRTPILSQEYWAHIGERLRLGLVFEKLGLDVEAVAYVRPQVEYLNSGWWQWWRWMRQFDTPDALVAKWGVSFISWGRLLRPWSQIEQVKNLSVRLHSGDVVRDFTSHLGLDPDRWNLSGYRKNPGMTARLVKLYDAVPQLRGLHDSLTDSVLGPLVNGEDGTPWVVGETLAERLIASLEPDNRALSSMMDVSQAAAMNADPRWWSTDAFKAHFQQAPDPTPLSRDEAVELLRAIVPEYVSLRI